MKFTNAVAKVYNDGKEVVKSYSKKWFSRIREKCTYDSFKKFVSWGIRTGKSVGREIRQLVLALIADSFDGLVPILKKVLKYAIIAPIACSVAPVLHPHAGTVWMLFGMLVVVYIVFSILGKVVKTMLTDEKAETETDAESETVEVKVEK